MPITIRTFVYNKILETYNNKNDEQNENAVEQGRKLAQMLREDAQKQPTTYTTKVSKK